VHPITVQLFDMTDVADDAATAKPALAVIARQNSITTARVLDVLYGVHVKKSTAVEFSGTE
jgi:hypothetical protein